MPKEKSNLVGKPSYEIAYAVVSKQYGGQVAALIDKMSTSRSQLVRSQASTPNKVRWEIVLDRAPDPEDLSSQEAILLYYKSNSKVYLKVAAGGNIGGKFTAYEELFSPPASIMAQFEQRAKLLADKRSQADDGPEEGTDVESGPDTDENLLVRLEEWLSANPTADKRLSYIARTVLAELIDSVLANGVIQPRRFRA